MENLEKEYITFILGYDLLHNTIEKLKYNECDIIYQKCKIIANDFYESDYNVSTMGMYECLVNYIEDNKNKLNEILGV